MALNLPRGLFQSFGCRVLPFKDKFGHLLRKNVTVHPMMTAIRRFHFPSDPRKDETMSVRVNTHAYMQMDRLQQSQNKALPSMRSFSMTTELNSLKKMLNFMTSYLLNYRFYFIYMARTTFQMVRPLLAFSAFGEVMKMALATISSGAFMFLFSFVLAFEVFYFFLQCYISYTFLAMFFAALF